MVVESILALHDASQGFHDIKALPDFEVAPWWPWILALVSVLILLKVLFSRKRPHSPVSPTMQLAPTEDPIEALSSLTQRWNRGDVAPRECAAGLSVIVRTYFERTCDIPALEQTWREVIQSLEGWCSTKHLSQDISVDLKRKMDRVVRVCERAAFSDRPEDEIPRIAEALDCARDVTNTIRTLTSQTPVGAKS